MIMETKKAKICSWQSGKPNGSFQIQNYEKNDIPAVRHAGANSCMSFSLALCSIQAFSELDKVHSLESANCFLSTS